MRTQVSTDVSRTNARRRVEWKLERGTGGVYDDDDGVSDFRDAERLTVVLDFYRGHTDVGRPRT